MLTRKEVDAIRFYEGDTRKRDKDGSILETEYNEGFFGIKSAYRTINCLMFDGIANEQERIKENTGKLVPQLYIEIEKVVEIYRDIFSAMYKCKECQEGKKTQIVYRTERGISLEELKKGYSVSFMSTSKKEEPEKFLMKKTGLTMLNIIVPSHIPQLDFAEVLADEYYFVKQKEILLPPFLEIELEEIELTEEENAYRDADNQAPSGKYLVTIKGIRENYPEAESSERKILTPERNQNAAEVLEKLIRCEEITEKEKEEYCVWKKDVRAYLWRELQQIQNNYCLKEDGNQKQTLISDVDKMIEEFDKKRKKYKNKIRICNVVLVAANTIPLVCMALSFMESLQFYMQITAIITSTISIFVSQFLRVEVYNMKLMQRSRTYLRLRELLRKIKYETDWSRKKEKIYIGEFQEIMRKDSEISLDNLGVQLENIEKMYQSEIKL